MIENLTIEQTSKLLNDKQASALEITDIYLKKINTAKKLNCFITVSEDKAIEAAKDTDERISKNKKIGFLDGVPLAYKDLFCTNDILTTASSKILSNFTPTYESTVTANCKDQGAVVLGKLNCDEFAMGSTNKTSFYGPVINPWKSIDNEDELVPGGSSGGSAASVAADLCVASLGTDTGGSIRQPASFTGLVGLKPTYGRVSRWGTVAFASSLDQAGPIAKTVEDAAILLQTISGHDNKDSTSSIRPNENFYSNLDSSVKGLKIGVPKEYMSDDLPEEIQKFWNEGKKILTENGAELTEVSLPSTKTALPAYYIIAPAEASSNLSRYDGVKYGLRVKEKSLTEMYESTRSEGFGDEVKRRIMIGTYVLSSGYYDAYYIKAQKIRSIIKNDFDNVFKNVDALFTPATPNTAFPINREETDPVQNYLNDIFTVPANLAGLPAISIPFGLDNSGLPIGMQIITNSFQEQMLLNISKNLQDTINFNNRPTQWWK
ncbi:Asp-tRNA(Asn)/Glu-tRNA(Gln) amidotransferase subunit GatA [Pelagibacterales bacterium]|jgi:aspartyl-tRNA(Asn)/glutamyl-tRNA(Gln) amidotransferase subunit A|nr:Asp-tRNA(Asn)/Glu-tRNA(Gln) amidotransferase subunit GatA [Pelagibacterales bacterium]MDB9818789.1 Asp-tRNA(Asn)/Glu-tRNA(Gln) amidotransferase subunit GatA [Pelagibacterales bacterium]